MLWLELLTNKEPPAMLKKLTVAQRAAYDENGYVDRIDIFTDSEIEEIVAELAEAEAAFGHELDAAGAKQCALCAARA
jgi:hypothetical protein